MKVPSVENLKADGLTVTECCLTKIIEYKHEFDHMCPKLAKVVEIVLTVPVSNAWPERVASKVKLVKTNLRNKLKNDKLDGLLHISVNGSEIGSQLCDALVSETV